MPGFTNLGLALTWLRRVGGAGPWAGNPVERPRSTAVIAAVSALVGKADTPRSTAVIAAVSALVGKADTPRSTMVISVVST